jgi:hemolysin activation/secretion protein
VVQWVDESLGADVAFTRWSVIDRRYYSLTDRLVFAHRYALQGARGDVPLHQLQRVQTSFKQGEGLGGSSTVRGLPKNRYAGKGMLFWNAELRWRVVDFTAAGRSFHAALSGFVDQGRVWSGGVRLSELFSDLHRGFGGGAHLGMGENFVASVDVAHSSEAGYPIYLSLGYLY